MNILAQKGDILTIPAELRAIGIFKDEAWDNDFITRLDAVTHGKFKQISKRKTFTGDVGQTILLNDYIITGLGDPKNIETNLREITGHIFSIARQTGAQNIAIELLGEDLENFRAKEHAQAITEALLLASYEFDTYKEVRDPSCLETINIVAEDGRDVRRIKKGIEQAEKLIDGVTVARDLINTPSGDMTPDRLAQVAQQMARLSPELRVRVYNKNQIEAKGMNALLAVAQGSDNEPRLIHITYKPKNAKKCVAIVGKGVTFDSGGLSLKPSEAMERMKIDMAGAGTVIGLFVALARLKPKVEVHGIIPAVENMPSGKALRPGDIVRASNKTTIEILNTDAEGRVILADALIYAQKQKPNVLIDIATLTGACVVALGEEVAGLLCNDDCLRDELLLHAKRTNEALWPLPLYAPYKKLVESDIADIKNIGTGRYGGILTAGLFLERFVEPHQVWAHLDIAGPAFAEHPMSSYFARGATGYGVRMLASWILSLR